MAQVVLITSGSGGAGKSRVSAHLARALCALDKRVMILEGTRRSLDMIFDIADEIVYDLSDAIYRRCELTDAAYRIRNVSGGVLQLICAPLDETFVITSGVCRQLFATLDPHFDFIFIDVDGIPSAQLQAYAAFADRAVIVCTPDNISARACRRVSDILSAGGMHDIRLCVNQMPQDFARTRPVPDIDFLIDAVCAQLVAVIPVDTQISIGISLNLSNSTKMIFDNFAQRMCGNYIDLLVR